MSSACPAHRVMEGPRFSCSPSHVGLWWVRRSMGSGLGSQACSSSNPKSVNHSLWGRGELITSLRLSFLNYKITIIMHSCQDYQGDLWNKLCGGCQVTPVSKKKTNIYSHIGEKPGWISEDSQSYIVHLHPLVHQGRWKGGVVFSKQDDRLGFSPFWTKYQPVIRLSIPLATSPVSDTEPQHCWDSLSTKPGSEPIFREDTVLSALSISLGTEF